MKRLRYLALLAFILTGCNMNDPVPAEIPSTFAPIATGPRIVAFGDSLTAGLGLAEDEAYPAQLERALATKGIQAQVVNAGISGDTSAQALDRLKWTLKEKPKVGIVVLGANDGLRGLDLKQLESNLTAIVRGFQDAGAVVLLGGMQIPPNYGAAYTRDFAAIYPRVAKATGATLIPFFLQGVAADTLLNQKDGIHPTAAGYAKIVKEVLLPALIPLLTAQP